MAEPDESPSRFATQRSDLGGAPVDFWSDERTEPVRLLVGHLTLWTSVLIAFLLPTFSTIGPGRIAVSAQVLVISVGVALAVSISARSRARAGIGCALALSALVVRALVMGTLEDIADAVGFYGTKAILIIMIVTGVTALTAGWLVARRKQRACLWALPPAAVLALVAYLLVDSGVLGHTIFPNLLGWTIFVIPGVVAAWMAVALDRWVGRAAVAVSSDPQIEV